MGRYRGYWWAPDGRHMLVARVDHRHGPAVVPRRPGGTGPAPHRVPYPAAGTANAEVSLWIATGPGRRPRRPTAVDWDNKGHEYLAAAARTTPGPSRPCTRDQREVLVLGIGGGTGATRVLADQRDDAWVTLVPELSSRTASGVLLTSGETWTTRAGCSPTGAR